MRGFFLTVMVGGALISSTLLWWNGSDILNESGLVIQQLVDSNIQLYNELEHLRNQPVPPVETCPPQEECYCPDYSEVPTFEEGEREFLIRMKENHSNWWDYTGQTDIFVNYANRIIIRNNGIPPAPEANDKALLIAKEFYYSFRLPVRIVNHANWDGQVTLEIDWSENFPTG